MFKSTQFQGNKSSNRNVNEDMIMNPFGVQSHDSGRDSSSTARRSSMQRVEPLDAESSLSSSLDINFLSVKKGEGCIIQKQEGMTSSFFPMSMEDSLEWNGSENQIQRISASNSFATSAHEDFQTIRTRTRSSQMEFSPSNSGSKKRSQILLGLTCNKAVKREVLVPLVYKLARRCMWDEFEQCMITSSPDDLNFVYGKDGTTIMHMVVMSRTGYINAFKAELTKPYASAPDGILEQLLHLCPQLAKVRCTINGYTPLSYACLVCSNMYPVEMAASMVRLLLSRSPDSIDLLNKDGLSPVDIHVVSYSHHHPDKEDKSSRGLTSVSVLKTLLMHRPGLARNRLQGDKIQGPLELLFKCNSKHFCQTTLDELDRAVDEQSGHFHRTLAERRQLAVQQVNTWWIWTWTIMLLKHGSECDRKWGTQFAAVHAAAMQIGCPSAVMKLLLFVFSSQAQEVISERGNLANFPLHAVCSWQCGTGLKSAAKSLIETRKSQTIAVLVQEYPGAAQILNSRGELPLELASKTGTLWEGGVRRILKAYPKALSTPSVQTGLYPFLTSAAAAKHSACPERQLQSLRTIYGLLRSNPKCPALL